MARSWLVVAVGGVLGLAAGPAYANGGDGIASVTWGDSEFTPTTTSSGTPLRWEGGCVFIRPPTAGAADIPGQLDGALATAVAAWNDATATCGYLQLRTEPADAGEVGFDYVNRIVVREDRWCAPGPPERCHDSGATALTTLFFVDHPGDPRDGVILDADIEVNAVDYALAICDGQPGGCVTTGTGAVYDLANVLTHELGHVMGLDHTCWAGVGTGPLDGDGNPVPPCNPADALPPEVKDATMYNFADPEEIKKRTPEADDITGACTVYPRASDPGTCAPVMPPPGPDADPGPDPGSDAGGCCSGTSRPPAIPVAGVVGFALLARRRRYSPRRWNRSSST